MSTTSNAVLKKSISMGFGSAWRVVCPLITLYS
jgi:hypothetical protein